MTTHFRPAKLEGALETKVQIGGIIIYFSLTIISNLRDNYNCNMWIL